MDVAVHLPYMENTTETKNSRQQHNTMPNRRRSGRRSRQTPNEQESIQGRTMQPNDYAQTRQEIHMPNHVDESFYLVGIEKNMRDLSIENIGARSRIPNKTARKSNNWSEAPPGRSNYRGSPRPPRQMDAENWRRAPLPPSPEKKQVFVHNDDVVRNNRRKMYQPFMSPDEMKRQIEQQTLYKGTLRINRRNRGDSYVTSDELEWDIYIYGQQNRNRALEGDVVAVRLLDVDKIYRLKKERDARKKDGRVETNEKKNVEEEEEEEEEEEDTAKPKYCGEIVGIIDREENLRFSGTLSIQRPGLNKGQDGDNIRSVWLRPSDKRIPFHCIGLSDAPSHVLEKLENTVMEAEFKRWPITSMYPFGRITGEIGETGDLEVQAKANLVDNNIEISDFSEKARACLPSVPWSIPAKEFKKRRDLRNERIFTIDPATAKDLDDAVHIKLLPDGYYEVGVHIADVSFFIRYDSVLDTEARKRGTSTYLVNKVVPMLPSLLCEELCSLNAGVDRLAFSVIWKMDNSGKVVDTWFGRTIIRSCAKLAYEDAQNVIDGNDLPASANIHDDANPASIADDISNLFALSKQMRQRRFDNGALSMNSVKLNFKLDANGEPVEVNIFESKEANKLIEEFMLRANISVAEKLCKHFPDESLLRRHPLPISRRMDEFIKAMEELGYKFDGSSAGSLQESFDKLDCPEIKELLLVLAIKPMQRAKYFCTGTLDISKYGHYALNEPVYTHFTSPIRRYADLIVHRQLAAALQNEETSGIEKTKVQRIALNCNRRKDAAKNAQEANVAVYLSRYLYNHEQMSGPIYEEAIVLAVHPEALEIYVPKYGLEKRIHTDSLPLIKFEYDKRHQTLSLFWKQGIQASTHVEEALYAKERERQDDYDGDEEEEDDGLTSGNESGDGRPSPSTEAAKDEDGNHDDDNSSQSGKQISRNPEQMIQERYLEPERCMQRFQMFTKLDIRIQVNIHLITSFINVYPVNPFAERAG